MVENTKPIGIKEEHTYVEDLCTGEKRELLFEEKPRDRSRCFFAEKFCVNEDGNLIKDQAAKDINHERIQLRLDWDINPGKRTGEGNPTLDADFYAYDAKRQKEEKKRLTGERFRAHHTEAENKGRKRTYTWRYKNCSVVIIMIAIEWHINIEEKLHLTDSSV